MQIRALLNQAIEQLKSQHIDSARLDAEILMMYVTKFNRVQLITQDLDELNVLHETMFRALIEQRLKGHPIAHLIGEREFWDLTLKVTPDTLIPRPDTEVLVEKALTLIDCNKFKRVLDLGTGTGAIILALKHSRRDLEAYAVDKSEEALEVAKENAAHYKLDIFFDHGSWFEPYLAHGSKNSLQPQFNIIVTNPPYIEEGDIHLSQGDVRFEPKSALVSGKDGLDDIRIIIGEAPFFLTKGGYLLIEHGYKQASAVRELLQERGFSKIETIRDLGQNERVTLGAYCLNSV